MGVAKVGTELPGPRSREIIRRKERVVCDPLDLHVPAVIDRGGPSGKVQQPRQDRGVGGHAPGLLDQPGEGDIDHPSAQPAQQLRIGARHRLDHPPTYRLLS